MSTNHKIIRVRFLASRRNRLLNSVPLRATGQTTDLKSILANIGKIMSCTFLNPVWEQIHKSYRTTGIGKEKTKHLNQGPVWSPHRKTGQKLKSLCSHSFAFLYISKACTYMQAMIQGEVSLYSLHARSSFSFPNINLLSLTSWRFGSSPSRGSRISPCQRLGASSYIPPINRVGLASLCFCSQLAQSSSCLNNWICFTSKTKWPHRNGAVMWQTWAGPYWSQKGCSSPGHGPALSTARDMHPGQHSCNSCLGCKAAQV